MISGEDYPGPPVAPYPEDPPQPPHDYAMRQSVERPPSGSPELTDAPWSVAGAIGLVVLMFAATLISGVGLGFVGTLDLNKAVESVTGGLILSSVYVVLLGVVWAVARRKGVSLAGSLGLRPVPLTVALSYGLGLAVAGRVLAGVWAAALQALDIRLPGTELDPTRVLGDGIAAAVMLVIVGVVLAPIVEEVVFRGVLMPAFQRRWGTAVAVIVSSLVFAVIHLSPYAMPPIFGLALILSASFVRTRSLWVPIAAHAMFNGIGIGLLYLARGMGLV